MCIARTLEDRQVEYAEDGPKVSAAFGDVASAAPLSLGRAPLSFSSTQFDRKLSHTSPRPQFPPVSSSPQFPKMSANVSEAINATAQEVGHKVFVGNLAFSTKDADLTEAFSKIGEISNAAVINRGTRSLGYGFVTFVKEADAIASVSALDKSDLSGRTINVELAKPPTSTPAGRAPREAAAAAVAATHTTTDGAEEPVKAKKPRAKRPKARKPRNDGETEEKGDAPIKNLMDSLAATNLGVTDDKASGDAGAAKAPRTRRPKAPVERRAPPSGAPSPTLLFVANLPFSVTDESLLQVFTGFKVNSARVVTKKFGPTQGRSKGFGFVDFESNEQQQAALAKLNGTEVEGREIQLKVALEHDKKDDAETPAEGTGLASGEIVAS